MIKAPSNDASTKSHLFSSIGSISAIACFFSTPSRTEIAEAIQESRAIIKKSEATLNNSMMLSKETIALNKKIDEVLSSRLSLVGHKS